MRPWLPVLAILTLALLGCQDEDGTTTPTSGPTTEGTSVTGRADEAAAREQQPRVREILQELWDQFDLEDKPPLEDKPGDGDLVACSLDTTAQITSWAEGAQLRVSKEKDPELEARQAALVRAWLDDNGWERIDNPAPESSPVTYHRNDDGFKVTVAPQLDARVDLDVESPCFDDQGQQVG
ncbi:hypothetical protein [uncultured Serinicoccus sp.]|uniref:hypothetical protein n=1 Tax=uncultured Serinicoccus sp. TaxID=735514 RepID=UPI0026204B0C|nr:hypothetical protein [uncultured Serinicoccus sp.]